MNVLEPIKRKIHEIRGRRVMLDSDLAKLYAVETRSLNQTVKRNIERFPDDFMFQLTKEEWNTLKSQNVIIKKNGRGQHGKHSPHAFTREGMDFCVQRLPYKPTFPTSTPFPLPSAS